MAEAIHTGVRLETLVPARYQRIRQVLQDENFGGRTLLFYLLGKLKAGMISVADLGLDGNNPGDEIAFLQKLEVITAMAVVVSARGGHYTLDEQVEDFLLFFRASDICRFQNMEKFHRAALPAILWAIAEDDKLRLLGETPEHFRMPVDLLVAIGAEVAEWHMAMTQEAGGINDEINEEIIRATMASTVRDTYRMITEKVKDMSLQWAVDEVRARFGIATVAIAYDGE
jgi:hypothetical protein